MSATIVDDRTESQKITHTIGIAGTDKFMSGWGGATGGSSVAIWAVSPDVSWERVYDWVKSRREMRRVRVVDLGKYRPGRGVAHVHIYDVDPGHPALSSRLANRLYV